jgi:hypothetical protein
LRTAALQQRLDDLEARKRDLVTRLTAPAPPPAGLRPNLAGLYRRKVAELHTPLADPELRAEALELIRGLIERIDLYPAEDGFRVELVGEIANMIALSAGTESVGSDKRSASGKVVAGARNCLDLLLSASIDTTPTRG